jgi:hypothetical protein
MGFAQLARRRTTAAIGPIRITPIKPTNTEMDGAADGERAAIERRGAPPSPRRRC